MCRTVFPRLVLPFLCLCLLLAPRGGAAEPAEPLFSTSFESLPVGLFEQHRLDGVTLTTPGQVEISAAFHHTGRQCLRIFGGTENTLDLVLDPDLRGVRGLRFQAERWTARSPFEFRLEARIDGRWEEVMNLDREVKVGARFRSEIRIALPGEAPIEALRLRCTAPADTGVLIDDLALLAEAPARALRVPVVATQPISRIDHQASLFVSGENDTHTYRIPALITAANGDLIAACDARRTMGKDLIHSRDIDIVYRRSQDHGETWSDIEVLCDFGEGRPASDPSFLLDETTGEIFCFYNFMDQIRAPREFRLYVQSSRDHGVTWSQPRDITEQITKPAWKMDFKFITSGRGIQTRDGMLLHTLVNLQRGLHLFGSRDHGRSWELLDYALTPANESKVIELADGRWMVNARVNGGGFRWVHLSETYGHRWMNYRDDQLVDPGCNASILRYTDRRDGFRRNRLLFSNANSFEGRYNLAVRLSYDEGQTWTEGRVIDDGPSAYSSLTVCGDGSIGLLYEPGHSEVRFVRITLEDLTDGQDRFTPPTP